MSAVGPKEDLSKTPSWIMVGFVLGMIAVLGFQHEMQRSAAQAADTVAKAPPPPEPEPVSNVTKVTDLPSLAVIEAVFTEWGSYARWEEERTEVALWNSTTGEFSDFFEVVRVADDLYFRSIMRLTRPLTDAKPPLEAPLRFTESAEEQEARRAGRLRSEEGSAPVGPWRETPAPADALRPSYLPPPAPAVGEPRV
jgi:hypothetical protein